MGPGRPRVSRAIGTTMEAPVEARIRRAIWTELLGAREWRQKVAERPVKTAG